jgi:sulfhydrogenase subunit beta (sulfur reductase)
MRVLDLAGLDQLLSALRARGFTVVGPTVHDGAIVLDEIAAVADLPAGWTDRQEAGTYRLERRPDGALFGWNAGPQAWKKYLFPPVLRLFRTERVASAEGEDGRRLTLHPEVPADVRYAFFGVRPCDLAALAVQDRVFLGGPHVDPLYRRRREQALIVAVHCGQAGPTCFCTSLGTGPRAGAGFDLALTELLEDGPHRFLAEVGSPRGAELLDQVAGRAAEEGDLAAAARVVDRAAGQMGRSLDTAGLPALLARQVESRRWDDLGSRCLGCANCTLVCPTCFCSTVEDTTDLTGRHSERTRRWDSCFTLDFSYLHGGSVRSSIGARYRQWLTHKLGTWNEQFGTSGCVGCGRCITWCPVGIDLTAEVRALRAADAGPMTVPVPPAPGGATS